MLKSYRPLFAIPYLPGLFAWSLLARLQVAGLPIGVTFLVADWTGSYALAGVVIGALTLGTAVSGPLRGRMADKGRTDRLLVMCGLVYSSGLVALAVLPGSLWWTAVPLALATGLFLPPASQIGRSLWPRLTTGSARTSMYAAEATFQELVFMLGPLLAALAVGLGGGRATVLLMAATSLTGALGFAAMIRKAGLSDAPAPSGGAVQRTERRRSLLFQPALVLLLTVCMLLIAGLAAVDLVIVAWARELGVPGYAGVLAAIWAMGSLVGGLVAGGLPGVPRIPRRALAAAFGIMLMIPLLPPITDLPTPWLLSPVLFVAGLAIAPTLAAVTERLSDISPEDRRGEAFGWMNTGVTTGVACSAPLTGWLIDVGGIALGVAGGAALVSVAALLTFGIPRSVCR